VEKRSAFRRLRQTAALSPRASERYPAPERGGMRCAFPPYTDATP
jgi:hypothetical protein